MTGTDTDHGDFGWIGEKRGANHLFDLRLCHALRPNGNRLAALSCTVGVRDVFGMLSLKKRPAAPAAASTSAIAPATFHHLL